jgi:SpoVK/Ycf46/Vps4 family AAA+-type ATPase
VGVEDVLAELDAMTGINEVKELVRGLVDQHRVNAMRTAHGLKAATLSPHLVFTGNPGTGKTTVARIVARAYHAVGLLKKGHVVEVGRTDLVAKYVGQTAIRTTEVCRRALGGVLFIDEAYSLNKESGNDFGHEAVETLLTFMENHRGEFAVVVAGYPREMGEFMAMNPGLTSRFDTTVRFPDFSDDELCEILLAMFGEHEYVLGPGAKERLRESIAALPRNHGFGNAREMRKLFGAIIGSHSRWVSSLGGEPSRDILRTIPADLIAVPRDATRLPVPAGGVYL